MTAARRLARLARALGVPRPAWPGAAAAAPPAGTIDLEPGDAPAPSSAASRRRPRPTWCRLTTSAPPRQRRGTLVAGRTLRGRARGDGRTSRTRSPTPARVADTFALAVANLARHLRPRRGSRSCPTPNGDGVPDSADARRRPGDARARAGASASSCAPSRRRTRPVDSHDSFEVSAIEHRRRAAPRSRTSTRGDLRQSPPAPRAGRHVDLQVVLGGRGPVALRVDPRHDPLLEHHPRRPGKRDFTILDPHPRRLRLRARQRALERVRQRRRSPTRRAAIPPGIALRLRRDAGRARVHAVDRLARPARRASSPSA